MRVLTLLWLAFVTAISAMPLKLKYRAGTTGMFHYPGHLFVFFTTAILLCRTATTFRSRLLGYTSTCAFALAIEMLEHVLYHNRLEWRDVLVDAIGAAAGLAVVGLFPFRSTELRNTELSQTGSEL